MNNNEIINYYNDCKKDYKLLWRLDKVWGMHYGYFEKGDFSLSKAILKMNDQILKYAKISSESRVLDAGCGYCGTAMHIASITNCKVEAITIVEEQVTTAQKIIESKNLQNNIHISKQDYTKTNFDNNSFDVIYAIESVCYADKQKFLAEAYRLLKKSGKLVILDGFNSKNEYSDNERKIMEKWNNGWAVDSLETSDYFIRESKNIGFTDQNFSDITKNTHKTSIIMYLASFPAFVIDFFGRLFGARSKYNSGNVMAAKYQYIGMKKKLWKYGIFVATK